MLTASLTVHLTQLKVSHNSRDCRCITGFHCILIVCPYDTKWAFVEHFWNEYIIFPIQLFFKDFIYLFEREKERERGRKSMAGRHREREKQTPH